MGVVGVVIGLLLVFLVFLEAFETIVVPRTVVRKIRATRLFYFSLWKLYRLGAPRDGRSALRESYLSAFGPLSLLLLIVLWALALILGFALIQWGLGSHIVSSVARPGFGADLYMSGTTFFTLGFGDVTPATPLGRLIAVGEAGVGFGFLAVVIGYLPVIYASFSRREVGISLLDARAGSPPTAGEMLMRHVQTQNMDALIVLLGNFENWASDLMESHLSYPVVAYYRSQHDRESWLSALTAILDVCALVSLDFKGSAAWERPLRWQARMTFAMARHAIVDLALVFNTPPIPLPEDRLPPEEFARICTLLSGAGLAFAYPDRAEAKLAELRAQYEPYVHALGERMLMSLPPWLPTAPTRDNWQASAWQHDSHL